ncbi:ATP-binding cassette domain-containing protein [Streptomyces tanashiensis]|uniref:ATP-binding cassette domain-containing protein n=1 Tax=Streptomyces tanashiensis TaxID=67367 RepID=UPI00167CA980|nr:ATP-binding cassette domain-containing protein [Streptomyces tanashiensis]GGY18593.1 hypothetical protein GCM10010299_25300 [Streptomyces tanashiensis]
MEGMAIRLTGLRKTYGRTEAVAGVDLEIADGEFFSMLGPSGSGKTTVLRMIAGFEAPSAGTVELAGRDVTRLAPFERDVHTVFQDYALFPHMTVEQNVAYGLKVRGVARAERLVRARAALAQVGLDGLGRRRPAELSGGQRQRVALARALVGRPRVLLLDEPLGALDLKLRERMQVELKAIQREVGITFVFVTHDQEEALTMINNVVARLRRLPGSYEEAAMDLGAHTFRVFWDITFPLLRSALLAGGLLAFALSFDEIVVTTFTAGPGVQTLPVWIFNNMTRPQQAPVVNVVAAALVLLSVLPIYAAQRLSSDTPGGGRV